MNEACRMIDFLTQKTLLAVGHGVLSGVENAIPE